MSNISRSCPSLITLVCLALVHPLSAATDGYQAPYPEPTAQETLLVELLNRFRANPSAEGDLMVKMFGTSTIPSMASVDVPMFLREMKALKPMPPMVMNLQLLAAARNHSYYMVHNGQGHKEDPSKPGFTGLSVTERCAAMSYFPTNAGECVFETPKSALAAHIGFVVDNGDGPGGMQPGRGHRTNMIGDFREVGASAVSNGSANGISVTENLGSQGPSRMVGGVIFADNQGTALYASGEGRGGVVISASDGSATTTWGSGEFAFELKRHGAVTIMAEYNGHLYMKNYPPGYDNIGFSWPMSPRNDDQGQLAPSFDSPSVVAKIAKIEMTISSGKVGAGVTSLMKLGDETDEPTATAAKSSLAVIMAWKQRMDAWIDKLQTLGDVVKAATIASAMAASYGAHPDAAAYRTLVTELKKADDYIAGQQFQKLLVITAEERRDPHFAKLVDAFMKKFPTGFYTQQAQALLPKP